jgi:hypothetical protein
MFTTNAVLSDCSWFELVEFVVVESEDRRSWIHQNIRNNKVTLQMSKQNIEYTPFEVHVFIWGFSFPTFLHW